jgi:hypothetical protein
LVAAASVRSDDTEAGHERQWLAFEVTGARRVWGVLRRVDGTSVRIRGSSRMAEPAGGDGFYVIVDPRNANRMVGEYTEGAMYSSAGGVKVIYAAWVACYCRPERTEVMRWVLKPSQCIRPT